MPKIHLKNPATETMGLHITCETISVDASEETHPTKSKKMNKCLDFRDCAIWNR